MKINSIAIDIQHKGLYLGDRQIMVRFVLSNTPSHYKDVPDIGKEVTPEELAAELKTLAKQKPAMICFTGGEPLLQVDYYKKHLNDLPLPLYFETNATVPLAVEEVKAYVSMFGLELVPGYEKEFSETMMRLKNNDFHVRLVVTKEITPEQVENYAKIIASIKPQTVFILEPIFGIKNYLALQVLALRHLSDVKVVPRMHL